MKVAHRFAAHRARNGLSLIEVLVSLSISTALLVAIGSAFHASVKAIAVNDAHFQCTQTARVALGQIVTELRRADAVQVNPSGLSIQVIRPAADLNPREIYREFSYDALRQRITTQVFYADNIAGPLMELAPHITCCEFVASALHEAPAGQQASGLIQVKITCSRHEASVSLSAAVTPRRAREF